MGLREAYLEQEREREEHRAWLAKCYEEEAEREAREWENRPHMVVGRTFEEIYFDTYREADAFVRGLPRAVIEYDGEIAIVEVKTGNVEYMPAEQHDIGRRK